MAKIAKMQFCNLLHFALQINFTLQINLVLLNYLQSQNPTSFKKFLHNGAVAVAGYILYNQNITSW